MRDDLTQLNNHQLQYRLLDAYAALRDTTHETELIRALKGELYRRGAQRDDIIRIAIAALIRQSAN
jgi:hypothetical protein